MIDSLARGIMGEKIDILSSIKGIGGKTAASFLIEMGGDIKLYDRPSKIIAMAGIDPAVRW